MDSSLFDFVGFSDTNQSQIIDADSKQQQNVQLISPANSKSFDTFSTLSTENSTASKPEIACVVKVEVENEDDNADEEEFNSVNVNPPPTTVVVAINRKRGRPSSLLPRVKIKVKVKQPIASKSKVTERKFSCQICHKSFNWNGNLTKHIENVHRPPKEYFKCDICPDYKTPWKITLDNHVRTKHKGEELRKLPCIFCSKIFLTSTELFDHLRTHTLEQPYFCRYCDKCFSLKANLQRHSKIHGDDRDRPWKCSSCFRTFFTQYELKLHSRRIHRKEKRFECELCSKLFPTTSELQRHKKSHSEVRNFKCEVCGKLFKMREALNSHAVSHSTKRKFKCEICGKGFKTRGGLHTHIFIHEPEKRFACELCGKRFQQLGGVRIHMQSHVEDPPHKCEICNWAFSLQSNLTRHNKTATHRNRVKELKQIKK